MRWKLNIVVCTGFFLLANSAVADTVEIILQPSDLLQKGNQYIAHGEIQKAKKILTRAIESNLTSRQRANAHNSLCVANIKEEAWQDAMVHCDAAIELVPSNWRFHNNRGNVYFGLGQFDVAKQNYARGLKIAPKSMTLATNIEMLENYVQARMKYSGRKNNPT